MVDAASTRYSGTGSGPGSRPGFGWRRWRWLRLSRAVGVFLDYRVRPYRLAAGSE